MPRYDYRCEAGHVTEGVFPMGEAPAEVCCNECPRDDTLLSDKDGIKEHFSRGATARRVFCAPAAIHFHGGGFYATDVKGALLRRRRPNVGDSLPKEFDHAAAALADAI